MLSNRTGKISWGTALLMYPLCFLIFSLALNVCLDFHQLHNDFWDVFFVSKHMTWADKQTWFNPQYPIGYCLFLKGIMGGGLPVVPAIMANMLFGFLTLLICARFYGKLLGPKVALASLVALSVFPQMFQYVNVGGGDPGSVVFFTAGTVLILTALYEFQKESVFSRFFIGGLLLGLAALFRYHALVASGMLVFALFCFYPRRWKSLATVSVGVFTAYSLQWIVNLSTGHGLLKTQFGPMNVYDLMYGLNWYRATDLHLPHSVGVIIGQNPALFLKKYLISFWSFKQAYLPALFASFFEKDPAQKKMARAIAIWIFIYFLAFSATTSGRQILLTLPLSFLAFGMSLRILWRYFSRFLVPSRPEFRHALCAITIMLLLGLSLHRDIATLYRRANARDVCKSVEAYIREKGCSRADQVFTSDLDLYFRALPGYIPYFNGGAPRLGTYLYNENFPEFPVDSAEAFVAVCKNRGVRYLVLNSDCHLLSPMLGELYDGRIGIKGLELEAEEKGTKVYGLM